MGNAEVDTDERLWVYPPTEQADKILVNPEHPPDCRDTIIWFPDKPQMLRSTYR